MTAYATMSVGFVEIALLFVLACGCFVGGVVNRDRDLRWYAAGCLLVAWAASMGVL